MGLQRLLLFTEGEEGGGVVVSSVDREADTLKLRITGRDIIIVEEGTIEIWRNTEEEEEETRQNAILALTSLCGFFWVIRGVPGCSSVTTSAYHSALESSVIHII